MTRTWRQAAATTALVLATGCTAMEAPATMGSAEDEAAIRGAVSAYASAYSAKDAAALAALVTEDYETVLPNGTRVSGRTGFQEMTTAEMAMVPAELTMTLTATTDYLRWLSADAAVAGGTWSAAGAPAEMGPNRGSWMGVFRRDADGQWRMATGSSTPDMPVPAAPPASPAP